MAGGLVQLTRGTFDVAATISGGIQAGLWIKGRGRIATLLALANNVNDDVFRCGDAATYVNSIQISDLDIYGNSANQSAGSGIQGQSVESLVIYNIEINSCKEHGINSNGSVTRNSAYLSVLQSYIHDNVNAGIYLNNQSYGANIGHNVIAGNHKLGASYAGISTNGNSDHVIHNNLLDANSLGIRFYNSSGSTVSGNTILNQEKHGIVADGSSHDLGITGNTIISPSNGTADTYDGITTDGTYNTIVGNLIRGIANRIGTGIKETTGADYNVIVANMIKNATFGVIRIGTNSIIRYNGGHITENHGVASNVTLDGSGVGIIAHGCDVTPTYANVICQSANLSVRVTSIDATNINIIVLDLAGDAVTADTHDFYWEAK